MPKPNPKHVPQLPDSGAEKENPKIFFIPLYFSEFLAQTRGMEAQEVGIYIILYAHMCERGEPILADSARLARLCGAPIKSFEVALETLITNGMLQRDENRLWCKAVEDGLSKAIEKSKSSKRASNTRWQKDNKNSADADASALQTQSGRNASQSKIKNKFIENPPFSNVIASVDEARKVRSEIASAVDEEYVDPLIRSLEDAGRPLTYEKAKALKNYLFEAHDPTAIAQQIIRMGSIEMNLAS